MSLVCKYCGKEAKSQGTSIVTASHGLVCSGSPSKKHVLVPNPPFCIYCAGETKSQGSQLVTNHGFACSNSPTKKHILAE